MHSSPHPFAYLFERFPSFAQTFVTREVEEMVRQGMNPWLVSLRRPEDAATLQGPLNLEVFYAPEEKALRAEVDARRGERHLPGRAHHAIPRHRQEPDSQRMFEAVWLGPMLRAKGIGHVHAHFGGMAARTAWWLRKLFGISYSFTGHANDIFCETDFPVSNAELVRAARFVVTETDYARHWMQRKYPAAQNKIFRVFNGVQTSGFPPRVRTPGIPRLISVGRLVEKKGFVDLIVACGLLRDRGVDFTCEIVGGGPLEEALRTQITGAGLAAHVQLLGPLAQSVLRQRLSEARIFVLACSPEEQGGSDNLPTVIMEAMLAGLPVISTALAGVPEMITSGKDGLLVTPQDPAALAGAIEKMLIDSEWAEGLGQQARSSAEQKFAVETTARALKHLLVGRLALPVSRAAREFDPDLPTSGFFHQLLQFLGK